jgi:hypothetical protein
MTRNFENKKENPSGGKEPMNPEDIGQDAIDRGQDTGIAEGVKQELTVLRRKKSIAKRA